MDADVLPLCKVKADLSSVPESKFIRAKGSPGGDDYFIVEFRLEMVVDNSKLKFFLVFGGEEYGSVECTYEDEEEE